MDFDSNADGDDDYFFLSGEDSDASMGVDYQTEFGDSRYPPDVRIGGTTYDKATVTEIDVPEGVTQIDNHAFKSCPYLKSITLPNSLTSIGRSAFCGCSSLVSINIPPSVTHIGENAFKYCSSLATVNVHPSTEIHPHPFCLRCTTLERLARDQNLSVIQYIRLQYASRINLRVAVHMCTNSKVRFDLNLPLPQANHGRAIAAGELDGERARASLNDDVWKLAIEFL